MVHDEKQGDAVHEDKDAVVDEGSDDGNGDDEKDKDAVVDASQGKEGDAVPEEEDVPSSQEYEESLSTTENLWHWYDLNADLVEETVQLCEAKYVMFLYHNAFHLFS